MGPSKDDNTNSGSQYLAFPISMLPIIQRYQILSLSKVLFMRDRATRYSTTVVSSVTIAGVLNGHDETRADAKSHQGKVHTKVLSSRGAENSMRARQGKVELS